jgi:uncharacterized membrane protein
MGYIYALLAAVGFGINDLCIQVGVKSGKCTTNQALLINLIAGNVILSVMAVVTYFSVGFPPLNIMGMLFFIAAGVCSPFFGRILSFASIKEIGATRTTTLRVSDAFFTIVIAYLILGDRISLQVLLGAVILVVGIMVLINETSQSVKVSKLELAAGVAYDMKPKSLKSYIKSTVGNINVGFFYAIISAVFFGMGGVFRQMSMTHVPSALLGTLVGTFTALITNGLYIHFSGQLTKDWNFTVKEVGFFSLGGAANSTAILFFFSALVSGTSVSITAALKNLSPLVTLFLTWLFLRKAERITPKLIYSIVLVLFGAFIIVSA